MERKGIQAGLDAVVSDLTFVVWPKCPRMWSLLVWAAHDSSEGVALQPPPGASVLLRWPVGQTLPIILQAQVDHRRDDDF